MARLRRISVVFLGGLALAGMAGFLGLSLTPQGQAISAQLQEKSRSGELEQALRLATRRATPDGMDAAAQASVEPSRDHLPETRIVPAIGIAERTPALPPRGPAADDAGWHHSFGTAGSEKHADIPWLDPDKARGLEPAWTYETPGAAANIQATPVFTGRMLVFPDARNRIVALAPETGERVWEFDPGLRQPARRGLVFVPGPGAEPGAGHIYFTAAGRVFALDARTGAPDQGFGTGGSMSLGYAVRVAPQVQGDTLYIASLMPGLHAVDRHTGARKWTVDLLSGKLTSSLIGRLTDPQGGFDGANPWGGMTLDAERGLVFLGLSNPVPVAYGASRPGDNAPANSVLAIDTATGEIRWQFQEIMHDLWDLDIAAPPVLARIDRDGGTWDVVAVPTKAGNLLLLDRLSGRPIFDWRLRRAPASGVPGERTAAYQPDPELPEPFGRMAFTEEDVTDIGADNRASVLAQLQDARFGFYVPHEPERQTVFFGLHGGAMHMGAALDPQRAVLFVAASHVPSSFTVTRGGDSLSRPVRSLSGDGAAIYADWCAACHGDRLEGGAGPSLAALDPAYSRVRFRSILAEGLRAMPAMADLETAEVDALYRLLVLGEGVDRAQAVTGPEAGQDGGGPYRRTAYQKLKDHEGYPGSRPPWGTLTAIDLVSGRHMWRVPLGRHDTLMARGIAQTGTENMSGPAVTSGGALFVSGTKDRLLRAFDARTGQEVWEAELPFIGSASPMLFEHDGAAYVVVPATGGGTLAIYDPDVETGSAFVAFRVAR